MTDLAKLNTKIYLFIKALEVHVAQEVKCLSWKILTPCHIETNILYGMLYTLKIYFDVINTSLFN